MRKEKFCAKLILFLTALCVTAYLAGLLYSRPYFFDSDSYYHIAFSGFIKNFGLRYHFPWLQFSVFKDSFADKDIFFHVLIVPFLMLVKNPVAAGKLALIFFNLLPILTYILVLKKYISAKLIAFIVALPLFSPIFTIYCLQLRSIHLAPILNILIIYFLINKKPAAVLILAFLYALSHVSFVLLAPMAIGAETLRYIYRKEFYFKGIWATLIGIALGLFLHPNFPNNLLIIFLNGIVTPLLAFSGSKLGFGGELFPESTKHSLLYNPAIFLSFYLVIWVLFFKRRKIEMETSIWFFCASLYLVLSFFANRYWYEANVYYFIFLGAFIGELKSSKIIGRYSRGIKITVAAFLGIALIFAAQNHKVLTDHMDFYGQRSGNLEETGQWMGKNLPPGKIIYHSYWDASSYFMCFNAGGYYINGLDPIYMYWRHKKEFELIDELMLGHIDKPEKVFNSVFKAEYGFVGIGEPLYCQIRNDPIHFEILYTNPGGLIFKTIPPKT